MALVVRGLEGCWSLLVLTLPLLQVYIPGRYQPCASSPEAYYTVAQMLVDDAHARAAGRAVWGYPKVIEQSGSSSSNISSSVPVCVHGTVSRLFGC
jgi:hypothetical protein